ncbi:hypothetical protein ZIOFF_054240 [Zingiber officinale]|uniref:Pre-rRNA-processing protein Ipi1 N-terminal domain-containing protein n=1 Tax=Zingiber officinale TaxID=94328 RepID=A0A8J5FK36_ZINOF|nr:hypothetical protein ZIOFF_054240 [Zingiber officinale]
MVRAKPASSKKQKRGVDFKKIRHKIGRRLPPPKNATNVQIKSKAIVLPQQSIASEKEGLAVNKKGLTLRELLQQTSHHNAKIRRAALVGIKDLIVKYPLELKLHKLAIIEKLRERICDNDKMVRDTLYHLLKNVIFPSSKEVLDNYIDILRNNQIYLVEKSKLINALAGLAHCLSLIANKGQRNDRLNNQNQEKFQGRVLHAYKLEVHEDHADEATAYAEMEYTDDDKYIILDIKIAQIFLCLTKWVNGIDFLSDKLVEFIEFLLLVKVASLLNLHLVGTNTRKKGAHMENHIVSLLPFIPRLLSQITTNGKARLLEAFTCSFKECRVDSRLFTAYLSVVEELLLVTINTGLQMHASSHQDHLSHEIAWMRELPRILLHLSDEHPSNTMVVLKVLLRIGQCSVPNSPLGFEYDALQFLLREFYAIRCKCHYRDGTHSGSINYGPFLKLPNDCKELALCCLCYFSRLTSDFLESLAYCCLCKH